MKIRLVSAFAALPLFFIVIYFAPVWATAIAIAITSMIAAHEMLYATGMIKSDTAAAVTGLVFAAVVPLNSYFFHISTEFLMFIFVFILFLTAIFRFDKFDFGKMCIVFFSGFVLPNFFTAILYIFYMPSGKILIILPFIFAWMTDTFAYFTGRAIGKHPLAPDISPKKTVEGAVGGVVGAVACTFLYIFIAERFLNVSANHIALAAASFAGSLVAQIGDLSLSVIKRKYGVKDYGTILPGHGGILDRFDSVIFVAPMVYIILGFVPLFY